ncbi:ComEC family competence protein [Nisaea acidiphila]|uniref:ComEC family competence protein n=1 Tax=Nisaea acidiphila TaxID=1862145 RepID=A0A9J7AY50_9PROT|nr:ComEC/Rec2 family competence protein [Nisaea acidiphila]UUX50357.1 ComEC family competence protein [Nisaea acidiphila]
MRDWTDGAFELVSKVGAGLTRFQQVERERAGLWLPVAFGAGIVGYFGLRSEPAPWNGIAMIGVAALVLLMLRKSSVPAFAAILLLGASAGFTAAQFRTSQVAAPVLARGMTGVLEGVVITVRMTPRGFRTILKVERLGRLPTAQLPARARVLLLKRDDAPAAGSRISIFGRFQPPPPPVSPYAYDFRRALFFERIGAVGFALAPVTARATGEAAGEGRWASALARLRQELSSRIRAVLTGDRGALAAALLVGDRDWISEDAETAMRDAGIAHLLAISGLHMGLVAGCVFGFVRLLLSLHPRSALTWPVRQSAAVAAILFATLYLLLSGASVPTLRAYVMTLIVLLGHLLGRKAISMRLIAAAALAIMAVRPEYVLSASFQLSFAAVTCLVAVYEAGYWTSRRRRDGWMHRVLRHVFLLALSSLVASLATLPVALYHFQKAALYGVASNLLAVPAAGIWIMPWGVSALVLMPLGLEMLALVPMGWGLDLLLVLAQEIRGWPHATHNVSAAPGWAVGMAVLSALWLCLWRSGWRFLGAVPLLCAVFLLLLSPWRPPEILISDRGRVVGVQTGRELVTSSGWSGFEAMVWRRRAGLGEDEDRAGHRFECDPLGCVYRAEGLGTIVRSSSAQSLWEDCGRADILVTRIHVPKGCTAPRLILGPRELRTGGAIAVWMKDGQPEVVHSRNVHGDRPWTARVRFRKNEKD